MSEMRYDFATQAIDELIATEYGRSPAFQTSEARYCTYNWMCATWTLQERRDWFAMYSMKDGVK